MVMNRETAFLAAYLARPLESLDPPAYEYLNWAPADQRFSIAVALGPTPTCEEAMGYLGIDHPVVGFLQTQFKPAVVETPEPNPDQHEFFFSCVARTIGPYSGWWRAVDEEVPGLSEGVDRVVRARDHAVTVVCDEPALTNCTWGVDPALRTEVRVVGAVAAGLVRPSEACLVAGKGRDRVKKKCGGSPAVADTVTGSEVHMVQFPFHYCRKGCLVMPEGNWGLCIPPGLTCSFGDFLYTASGTAMLYGQGAIEIDVYGQAFDLSDMPDWLWVARFPDLIWAEVLARVSTPQEQPIATEAPSRAVYVTSKVAPVVHGESVVEGVPTSAGVAEYVVDGPFGGRLVFGDAGCVVSGKSGYRVRIADQGLVVTGESSVVLLGKPPDPVAADESFGVQLEVDLVDSDSRLDTGWSVVERGGVCRLSEVRAPDPLKLQRPVKSGGITPDNFDLANYHVRTAVPSSQSVELASALNGLC